MGKASKPKTKKGAQSKENKAEEPSHVNYPDLNKKLMSRDIAKLTEGCKYCVTDACFLMEHNGLGNLMKILVHQIFLDAKKSKWQGVRYAERGFEYFAYICFQQKVEVTQSRTNFVLFLWHLELHA